jgi:chromosome partitioning protein
MHIITLVSRRGGTGKSTLAIGIAIAAMENRQRVCVLEADPLGTVSNWRRRRGAAEPTVESVHDQYALYHRVPELARRGLTLTIIDTAGGWSAASGAAIAVADFCLIPSRPTPTDIEAAAPTLAAVRESRKPFAFVLNQVQARSTHLKGAAGSLGERAVALKMADVLALPAIVLRNDQQDAVGVGLGVTEYAPHGKSAQEIRGLWQWVEARLTSVSQPDAEASHNTKALLPVAPDTIQAPLEIALPFGRGASNFARCQLTLHASSRFRSRARLDEDQQTPHAGADIGQSVSCGSLRHAFECSVPACPRLFLRRRPDEGAHLTAYSARRANARRSGKETTEGATNFQPCASGARRRA